MRYNYKLDANGHIEGGLTQYLLWDIGGDEFICGRLTGAKQYVIDITKPVDDTLRRIYNENPGEYDSYEDLVGAYETRVMLLQKLITEYLSEDLETRRINCLVTAWECGFTAREFGFWEEQK